MVFNLPELLGADSRLYKYKLWQSFRVSCFAFGYLYPGLSSFTYSRIKFGPCYIDEIQTIIKLTLIKLQNQKI